MKKRTLHLLPNAHIDPVWLWNWREGITEAVSTCRCIVELMQENPDAFVTADEIGCGIVPMEAFERDYRETDGRICQRIAAYSEEVHRVICGLGMRIK